MNVLLSVDMEGVAGVVNRDQTNPAHKEYERFRRLMTAEANAAIEGALAGGAQRVVVNDSHASMTNILIEELNPGVELISGSPKPFAMMQGIGADVDAVFFVGYHGMSGTRASVIEHTWQGNIVAVSLNGKPIGEIGLNAALAGSFGAPVVLISGDRCATEEACALLGPIETVVVKEGISRLAAQSLHPTVAQKRIRAAAERALKIKPAPFVVQPPIALRIMFERPIHADMAELIRDSRRADSRTVEWTGPDMPTVYKVFRAMLGLGSPY